MRDMAAHTHPLEPLLRSIAQLIGSVTCAVGAATAFILGDATRDTLGDMPIAATAAGAILAAAAFFLFATGITNAYADPKPTGRDLPPT